MSVSQSNYLSLMRADNIPPGESGLWYIEKRSFPEGAVGVRHGIEVASPAGTYTYLFRWTESTLHQGGDLVMEDTPWELSTHIGFILQAHGRVLVTGLGLGCVVRGLLANPAVNHVTCIENSPDVLKLVAPYMPSDRLEIVEEDAFRWVSTHPLDFDCAWHDLWTNRDTGEPHLDIWHADLLFKCRHAIPQQGAWAFNRDIKRRMIEKGFGWIG